MDHLADVRTFSEISKGSTVGRMGYFPLLPPYENGVGGGGRSRMRTETLYRRPVTESTVCPLRAIWATVAPSRHLGDVRTFSLKGATVGPRMGDGSTFRVAPGRIRESGRRRSLLISGP